MTKLVKHNNYTLPQQEGLKIDMQARVREVGPYIEYVLSLFWRDELPAVRAIELEEWHDQLRTLSEEEIRQAFRDYQRTGARTKAGALLKPCPYDIYSRAIKARPPLPKPKEKPKPKPTIEERAKVQAMVDGFIKGHKI